MSTTLQLRALRGDDPLGFLAAVGTLRLATLALEREARLAFLPGAVPIALLEVEEGTTLHSLAGELERVARAIRADEGLLFGVERRFPPRKVGAKGGDPARLRPGELDAWRERTCGAVGGGGDELGLWLSALYSSSVADEQGRAVMSPFYAPSGQMTLAGSLADPLRIVASEPGHVEAAFTGWRRVAGFTGANLDLRALRDAGVEPSGKPTNRGTPGPTWLALEGIGIGRAAGRDEQAPAVLWQRRRPFERGHRAIGMVWPTWRPPLDLDAVRVVLEHPAARLATTGDSGRDARASRRGLDAPADSQTSGGDGERYWGERALDRERRALGITAIWRSERVGLSQSDGPLGAAQRMWPDG